MNMPLGTFGLIVFAIIGLLGTSISTASAQTSGAVLNFESVADLRAYNTSAFGTTVPQALTAGYYVKGDGGANQFFWSGTTTADDNGGTVIKPSAVPSTSPGRWLATHTGTFNVKAFGAKADGTTDDTAAFNATLAAAGGLRTVQVPGGTYLINGQVDLPANSVLLGGGFNSSIIKVTSRDATDATLKAGGENCAIEDLQITFTQPDNAGVTLANIVDYKPAIRLAARCRVRNILIGAAWDGIDCPAASQSTIQDASIGAFNRGIIIRDVTDTIRIVNLHLAGFNMGGNNGSVFYSLNQNSIGISVAEAHDLDIIGANFLGAGRGILTGVDGKGSNVKISDSWFDSYRTLAVQLGDVTATNCYFYNTGTTKIVQTGGTLKLIGCSHFMAGAGQVMSEYHVLLSGGTCIISQNAWTYVGTTLDQTGVYQDGGTLMLSNSHFAHPGPDNYTFYRPVIYLVAGNASIHNNFIDSISPGGTGTFISSSASVQDDITGNRATGWITPENWNGASLANSWVNYDNTWNHAQVRKEGKTVHIRGLVRSGAVTPYATLLSVPTNYKPLKRQVFPVVSSGGPAAVYIDENGELKLFGPLSSNGYLSLNLSYRVD